MLVHGTDTTVTMVTLPSLMLVVSLPMLTVPLPLPRPLRFLLLSKPTLPSMELLLPQSTLAILAILATLHGPILALLPTLMVLLSLLNPQRLLLLVLNIWLPMPLLKRTN